MDSLFIEVFDPTLQCRRAPLKHAELGVVVRAKQAGDVFAVHFQEYR